MMTVETKESNKYKTERSEKSHPSSSLFAFWSCFSHP